MNDLIEEIEYTEAELRDLRDDVDNFKRQNAYGMTAVAEGQITRMSAYLQGLRKAKELIDE